MRRGFSERIVQWSALLVAACLLNGCQTAPSPVSGAVRTAIQLRTETVFEQAVLFKPETRDTNALRLAPLILQQVTAESPGAPPPGTVFTWTRQGLWSGQPVEQVIYVWSYDQGRLPDQGVRITLNEDGLPILWEVLRDQSGLRVLYVAQSLEAEAMRAFSAPLPGHRYWIEPPPGQSPHTVIARVLDETDVPMGPIVYLEANHADVTTIICRCMDAQAKRLVSTASYEPITLDDAAIGRFCQDKTSGVTHWLPGKRPDELSKDLRVKAR